MRLLALALLLLDTSPRTETWRPYSWQAFKPGSWARYKYVTRVGGQAFEVEMKMTVKELTETEVVLTYEMTQAGATLPPQEVRQPLDQTDRNAWAGGEVKAEGREHLQVAGRRLPCRWSEYRVASGDMEGATRVWTTHLVPTSIARMVMKTGQYEMEMELTGFERK